MPKFYVGFYEPIPDAAHAELLRRGFKVAEPGSKRPYIGPEGLDFHQTLNLAKEIVNQFGVNRVRVEE